MLHITIHIQALIGGVRDDGQEMEKEASFD